MQCQQEQERRRRRHQPEISYPQAPKPEMKRGRIGKFDTLLTFTRQRSTQILIVIALLYVLFVSLEIPFVFRTAQEPPSHPPPLVRRPNGVVSGLILNDAAFDSLLYKSACQVGKALWAELKSGSAQAPVSKPDNRSGPCPGSIWVSGPEFLGRGRSMVIPCGLTLGSHVTVVGEPLRARRKACQFVMELQGLKTVEGEEPPRVLHFNPRLKGDWSGKPVIELNTCYRMHWGTAMRCDGWKSRAGEDTGKKKYVLFIMVVMYETLYFNLLPIYGYFTNTYI